ncbi:hypothetical protein Pan181_38440 [Aeoliella mucimassa]|uniref:Uncharacterized protein n=1 Tax=Aeoliella mucimassa TaxID=2527972 RepID=A0A518ASC5_9BACT|nr:hypothetical protein Pan181_38440 [Aeoliella mucimassa]
MAGFFSWHVAYYLSEWQTIRAAGLMLCSTTTNGVVVVLQRYCRAEAIGMGVGGLGFWGGQELLPGPRPLKT